MRASKLRLPESTAATDRSRSVDLAGDLVRQRAGVADAGRAAEADQVEAAAGRGSWSARPARGSRDTTREPGARLVFTQGLVSRPALDRLLGQQPGRDHQRRVGRVRAAGDRGDGHRAVAQLGAVAMLDAEGVGEAGAATPGSDTRSCGRRGPGQARLDLRQVEVERLGVRRNGARRRCGTAPAPWCSARPARSAPPGGRCRADSPASRSSTGKMAAVEPNSGDMFEIVARSATVSPDRPGPENSTKLADHAVLRAAAR